MKKKSDEICSADDIYTAESRSQTSHAPVIYSAYGGGEWCVYLHVGSQDPSSHAITLQSTDSAASSLPKRA
jgi:hypothetical protein